jgi:hypothetical protein
LFDFSEYDPVKLNAKSSQYLQEMKNRMQSLYPVQPRPMFFRYVADAENKFFSFLHSMLITAVSLVRVYFIALSSSMVLSLTISPRWSRCFFISSSAFLRSVMSLNVTMSFSLRKAM